MPFLALSASELNSRWFGKTGELIRDLFARAQAYAPAIIFIDEIDAIGASRGGMESDPRSSALTQLLSCMDGYRSVDRPVFVLAATNHPEALDPALRRPGRFDEAIPIDLPHAVARRAFFTHRLRDVPGSDSVDAERLVRDTVGCAPAHLDRIVREAAYLAAVDGREAVTDHDFSTASRLVRFGAHDEGLLIDDADRRLTAYHESGHALCHLVLFPNRPLDHITIVPTEGGALGYMAQSTNEGRVSITMEDVQNQIAIAMAGREAERLVLESDLQVTTGASSDLRVATKLAHTAIAEWGFDEEYGLVASHGLPSSESSRRDRLEASVDRWLRAGRERAAEILSRHRVALDALAAVLLERESLDDREVRDAVVACLAST